MTYAETKVVTGVGANKEEWCSDKSSSKIGSPTINSEISDLKLFFYRHDREEKSKRALLYKCVLSIICGFSVALS